MDNDLIIEDLRATLEELTWGVDTKNEEAFIAWAERQNGYFMLDGPEFFIVPYPPVVLGTYRLDNLYEAGHTLEKMPVRSYVRYPSKNTLIQPDPTVSCRTTTETGLIKMAKEANQELVGKFIKSSFEPQVFGHEAFHADSNALTHMRTIMLSRVKASTMELYNDYRR